MRKLFLAAVAALAMSAPAFASDVEADVNFNKSECVTTISDIGSTTYVNICNGAEKIVEWGSADWIGALTLFLVVLALIGVFVSLLVVLIRDM